MFTLYLAQYLCGRLHISLQLTLATSFRLSHAHQPRLHSYEVMFISSAVLSMRRSEDSVCVCVWGGCLPLSITWVLAMKLRLSVLGSSAFPRLLSYFASPVFFFIQITFAYTVLLGWDCAVSFVKWLWNCLLGPVGRAVYVSFTFESTLLVMCDLESLAFYK